ncbi:alginate O-acetyltransferase AlgX-related protein [Aureispira anguillae]|nr:hypothetical protein [Aureispira anguillae]
MIQEEYHWVNVGELDGYDPSVTEAAVMSVDNWLSGAYQVTKEGYRDRFFGFRNWTIRLNNQVKYNLYKASEADNIVVGKDHYLYGIDYIDAYRGEDFVGENVVKAKVRRFKQLQDTLSKLGKHLFFVITPNKADYFDAFLPTIYQGDRTGISTNYDSYIKHLKAENVNHIDVNEWFVNIKDTVSYPLFPQTGIHMTHYGSALFADSLIRYIEGLTQQDLPNFSWSKVALSSEALEADADAEKALNLIFKLPYFELPYPSVHIDQKGKYKPTALTIGDSFYWTFVSWGGLTDVFDDGQFWYYNREQHPGQRDVKTLDLEQEIKDKELIFIVNSAFNLWRFGFGFDLDLYKHFFGDEILKDEALLDLIVQERMKTALKDKAWMKSLRAHALETGQEFEKVLYDNITYVVKKKLEK